MRTLAVIPARLEAARLSRKPLRELGGVPLVIRVWERVVEAGVADRVVVATDRDEVAHVVRSAGGECVLTSLAHVSGTDRVAEVAALPEFASFDLVLNVQGDEPFVDGDAMRGALDAASGVAEIGTTAVRAPAEVLDNPAVVKLVCGDDGRALYFSRAPIPFLRDPGDRSTRDALVLQHLGVYAYTRGALAAWVSLPPHPLEISEHLEQLRPLAAGMRIGVATATEVPLMGGIDTESDLERANAIWSDFTAGRT